MLNLLTDEYKKEVLGEYRKRLLAMSFALITLAVLIACISLVPTYLSIIQKKQSLETDKTLLESKINLVGDESITAKVQSLTKDTDALQPLQMMSPDLIINHIISKGEKIKIGTFSLTLNADQAYTLDISGIAPDRESLISFSKTLKNDPSFVYDEKSLPLSSFTKTKDINFSLKMGVVATSTFMIKQSI